MSGLILCNHEKVKHPFYIEELGIQIFSGEELCYIIYHHFFVFHDGLVNEKLLEFIRDELGYQDLAGRLFQKLKDVKKVDEILLDILKEITYFSILEMNQFKDYLGKLKKMHPAQLLLEKANYYLRRKRYGISIRYYEDILEYYEKELPEAKLLGSIWSQLASVYANLFEFQKAARAYEKAFKYVKGKDILKKLYFLAYLNEDLQISDVIENQITLEERVKWKEEIDDIRMEALTGDKIRELNQLFQKDSIRRKEGAGSLLYSLKEEYRSMC